VTGLDRAICDVGSFDAWVRSATLAPMTLDEIKEAIANLSPEELAQLRVWLAQFGSSEAPAEPTPNAEAETPASKFGRLAGRAVADIRKRMRET
jgi:hypothetical protein